ncbi:MAG: hypothetical protein DWQ37_20985 [Planctomycetota bacterium]|nr:MAG: hypothetical protein DWQ37_20985 [Planctomycetota bacterium]
MYHSEFSIEPIHEHCSFEECNVEFANVLARAAADRLGAYSPSLSEASPRERARIGDAFGAIGPYVAFQLLPGRVQDCEICASYCSYLFTNWFYGVAWDWCFVLLWRDSDLAWVGMLTDTD